MKRFENLPPTEWENVLVRPQFEPQKLFSTIEGILSAVKQKGDAALLEYTSKFDKVDLDSMLIAEAEWKEATLEMPLQEAIQQAYKNISTFHALQKEKSHVVETMPGVTCWRKSVAIEKVGLYIPGGLAPLFSTVLMLAIPAQLAGCKEIVLCTPPSATGKIHPAILYAAKLAGVTNVFKVGGAQAIAAMVYGTETVPKVDKIFGPGNQYVTAAKMLAQLNGVAIDMPAGPSEVLVWADETANPAFVAADLLAQAEHGPDSQVVLVCSDGSLADACQQAIAEQLASLPRQEIAAQALQNSVCIVEPNPTKALELINFYAPEHLILSVQDADAVADRVVNAGSIFIGHLTPESVGDYASGTNHTLPTYGAARAYSGVSLDSFVKKITYQKLDANGLRNIGPYVEKMAEAEALHGHKNAVTLRLKALDI